MGGQYGVRKGVARFVEQSILQGVSSFYPSTVAEYVGSPVSTVFKYLLHLVEEDELFLKWQLICPNVQANCFKKIEISDEKKSGSYIECDKCGFEFTLKESDYIPFFEIVPKFKEYILAEEVEKKKFPQE